mmetsp:Transcript_28749/g.70035  ORF Transcript_28749/g.70035 Transcript_28749/m.70035 type:complete len:328 (+) Transcript_28749:385-1368(+)
MARVDPGIGAVHHDRRSRVGAEPQKELIVLAPRAVVAAASSGAFGPRMPHTQLIQTRQCLGWLIERLVGVNDHSKIDQLAGRECRRAQNEALVRGKWRFRLLIHRIALHLAVRDEWSRVDDVISFDFFGVVQNLSPHALVPSHHVQPDLLECWPTLVAALLVSGIEAGCGGGQPGIGLHQHEDSFGALSSHNLILRIFPPLGEVEATTGVLRRPRAFHFVPVPRRLLRYLVARGKHSTIWVVHAVSHDAAHVHLVEMHLKVAPLNPEGSILIELHIEFTPRPLPHGSAPFSSVVPPWTFPLTHPPRVAQLKQTRLLGIHLAHLLHRQ